MESIGSRRFSTRRKKEAHGGDVIDDRADSQLSFVQQMGLPLSNMIRAEPIRWLAEILREPLDSAEIAAYSFGREVTTLELFQHQFT